MKGSLGRRVLLLAPLAPLLAAPASVLAVPSVEDKRKADREKAAKERKADREKAAKERLALQKKSQDRSRRDAANAKQNSERARKQLADAKKKDAKDKQKAAKQRIAKQKEDAKIARIKEDKRRRAQGKKIARKSGGLGFFNTVFLVGGLGLGALVLADDENSADGAPPAVVEDAVAAEETPA